MALFTKLCTKTHYLHNYYAQMKSSEGYSIKTLLNRYNPCKHFDKNVSTHTINMDSENEDFKNALPAVISSLQNDPKFYEIPEAANWMKKMLEYTVTGGKNTRGLTTVMTYKMLQDQEKITEDSLNLARTLGWCVEMFQAYCVIVDDIMDNSITRRGSPCWYRRPDVGLACAINDSIMVNSALFQVLRTHCAHLPNYIHMVHLMNETVFHTSIGQHLDYKTAQTKKDYSKFTIKRYYTIVKYKSAYYTFYLPLTFGLLLADKMDQKIFKHVLPICLEMGKLFQIQDDFIDCFGNEEITGKKGTDIQEGKCSWLAVNALYRCTNTQRIVFKACYGSTEPAHIERIRHLYEELQLPELYRQQEHVIYEDILQRIKAIPCEITQQLFNKILHKYYQRKQ